MLRWLTTLTLAAVALALVIVGRTTSVAPAAFSHGKHSGIACLQCHHDWRKSRATQRCKGCHLGMPDLRQRLETDFHMQCRGCHLEPLARRMTPAAPAGVGRGAESSQAGAASSPKPPPHAARCSGCHAEPRSPWPASARP